MALTATTLSSAVAVYDRTIVVASATGFAVGRYVKVDGELMRVDKSYDGSSTTVQVERGRDGTAQTTHVASAVVLVGIGASDFSTSGVAGAAGTPYLGPMCLDIRSYTTAAALDLPAAPCIAVRIINGTSNPAMTLAQPTKDLDGTIMYVLTSGKCTATLTVSTSSHGVGDAGASYDVLTAQSAGQIGLCLVACDGNWLFCGGILTGTTTALSWAIA